MCWRHYLLCNRKSICKVHGGLFHLHPLNIWIPKIVAFAVVKCFEMFHCFIRLTLKSIKQLNQFHSFQLNRPNTYNSMDSPASLFVFLSVSGWTIVHQNHILGLDWALEIKPVRPKEKTPAQPVGRKTSPQAGPFPPRGWMLGGDIL